MRGETVLVLTRHLSNDTDPESAMEGASQERSEAGSTAPNG